MPDTRPSLLTLALVAIAPVVLVSFAGSAVTQPAIPGWYADLEKPAFNPPNWLFAPVWTALFAMMAYAVFRILRLPAGTAGRFEALALYHTQLVLNAGWSVAFFGLQSPPLGIVMILLLLTLILTTMRSFWQLDAIAGWLFVPYAAWVAYATLLNLSLWWLNR